jgi:hypothetical protein
LLAILFTASASIAGIQSYVNARVASVEKHAENLDASCSQGTQNYLIIGFKVPTGETYFTWISTSNSQYKDLESIALTALSTGVKVTAQSETSPENIICGVTSGKLRFIQLTGG